MDERIVKKIDEVIEFVQKLELNELFENEKKHRLEKQFDKLLPKNQLLELLSKIIVYSQNANSEKVSAIINSIDYKKAFENFDIVKLSKKNPCDIADVHWESIKGIRQQTKIFQIVTIARRINSNKFDYNVFNNLPKKIESKDDFDLFWVQFKIIQNNFKKSKIPFFQSTTTLLHLLMEMGFYCVKPDVIVMKIASEIGIVNKEMNNKNFIEVVKILQEYSINKNIKPSIIDLCFLIKGNQKSTTKFFKTI